MWRLTTTTESFLRSNPSKPSNSWKHWVENIDSSEERVSSWGDIRPGWCVPSIILSDLCVVPGCYDEEGAEPEGKTFDSPINERSKLNPWSWALGSSVAKEWGWGHKQSKWVSLWRILGSASGMGYGGQQLDGGLGTSDQNASRAPSTNWPKVDTEHTEDVIHLIWFGEHQVPQEELEGRSLPCFK